MALKKDLLLNFRHSPNAIFSNLASFALKAAGRDDWFKKNIHHETPCILLSSMKVNMCVHQRVQCMTRTYKTTGNLLRNKTEVHTALYEMYANCYTLICKFQIFLGEDPNPPPPHLPPNPQLFLPKRLHTYKASRNAPDYQQIEGGEPILF